ncbi:mitochondrial import inner membrane translocase subunit Tim21 isoform X2 [Scaptodrosophila lebanonensis]|uniref:Mitochondrial import inner membrane translocase subunit Tim21 n=1 Tax=Drosophila lebanonensis TaxID=7225 RepID=A0A6J2TY81_DROLE|nr:mitochondrial import inner membrane translocase subunit Tim21 isoform X2 [Scaptodrosophila lebanonensis]
MSQLTLLRYMVVQKQQHLLLPAVTRLKYIAEMHLSSKLAQEAAPRGSGSALQESRGGGGDVSTDVRPIGEKIKENTKTASYGALIAAGLGVTGFMLFAIFRELFSSTSPNNIYADALERVVEDPRVQDAIGSPIKGFGETSRRGRRQHVAHISFERNGVPHMRMQFYVQGLRNKATVHLESRNILL